MPAAGIYRIGRILQSIVRPAPGNWERAGSLSRPVKSWLSISDQVQRLRSRGMDVADLT